MKRIFQMIFLITGLIFYSQISKSQKVALVLSGGGAKGLAHIGVIKALEENNIPIDCIAGTSMGAIVGALYASGYSTDEMIELIKSDQFKFWSSGEIEEEYIYYFKKHQPDASWLELKFQITDSTIKTIIPTNIFPNHQMDMAFFQLFTPAAASVNYNFDSLFVPFRCVATDIYKNEAFVLDKGQLSSAVRASMTYPFVFKPISINNALLFDGGMINNFPVDVAMEKFHPDFIIGSKVAKNSLPPDEDDFFLQLENMLLGKTDYSIPKGKGILIEPITNDVDLMDFQKIDTLVESGYLATIILIDSVKSSITRRITLEQVNSQRANFKKNIPDLKFDRIIINGLNSTQRKYAINNLRLKKEVIDFNQLKKTYFRLVEDDIIKSMYPTALLDSTGYFTLFFDVKRDNRFEANFGGNISSTSLNQAFLNVQYKHLSKKAYNISANTYFGRFYDSIQTKARVDFPPIRIPSFGTATPFYYEIEITHNRWDFFKSSNELFFADNKPSYLIQYDLGIRSSIGFPIKTNSKLVVENVFGESIDKYYQTNEFLKADTADKTTFDFYTLGAYYERNTLNYKQFPNKGSFLKLSTKYIKGNEYYEPGSTSNYIDGLDPEKNHEFFRAKFNFQSYKKIAPKLSMGFLIEGVYTSKYLFYNYTSTMLNAPVYNPIPQSKTLYNDNYRSYSYAAIGLQNIYHFNQIIDLRLEGYLFQPYEKIGMEQQLAYFEKPLKKRYLIASGGLIIHTLIGPVSFVANYYAKQDQKFYFLFNFGYLIFNNKATE